MPSMLQASRMNIKISFPSRSIRFFTCMSIVQRPRWLFWTCIRYQADRDGIHISAMLLNSCNRLFRYLQEIARWEKPGIWVPWVSCFRHVGFRFTVVCFRAYCIQNLQPFGHIYHSVLSIAFTIPLSPPAYRHPSRPSQFRRLLSTVRSLNGEHVYTDVSRFSWTALSHNFLSDPVVCGSNWSWLSADYRCNKTKEPTDGEAHSSPPLCTVIE